MRRLYIPKASYFITTNPYGRIPFFEEDALCKVLRDVIFKACQMKGADVIGFKINPEHSHLIIQVGTTFNISQVMHSIKRISSDHINQLLAYGRPDNRYASLQWDKKLEGLRKEFTDKYPTETPHEFPLFKWQKGFDDKLIRSSQDLEKAINYLRVQHKKHNLTDNKFLFINKRIPNDIKFSG